MSRQNVGEKTPRNDFDDDDDCTVFSKSMSSSSSSSSKRKEAQRATHMAKLRASFSPHEASHRQREQERDDDDDDDGKRNELLTSKIFCNRSLPMKSITSIGFDMDYTLAMYKPETFERLVYTKTVEKLVSHYGYPKEILTSFTFDETYMVRGLASSIRSEERVEDGQTQLRESGRPRIQRGECRREVSDVLRQFESWDDLYRERVSSDGYVVRVGRSVFILPVGGDERYGSAR